MQQSPPAAGGGVTMLKRYAPLLAILVVVGILVAVFAVVGGDDDRTTDTTTPIGSSDVPITYDEAKAEGTTGDYDWGKRCDTERARIAMPLLGAAPCVPIFTGDNGGATHQGVTADTITVAYYVAKPDPLGDALLKAAGAFDEPETVVQTLKNYTEIYQTMYETYGRTIKLVPLKATGTATDEAAARADAIKADEELGVLAVLGGPTQARAFAEELAARQIMCLGSCMLAQPEKFYRDNSPYLWPGGPSPDQTAAHIVEFIEKQLLGKNAEYAGDEKFQSQERVFGMLTYDTPDGNFQPAWDNFQEMLTGAGIDVATRVTYFLDLPKAQEDSRTIVTKLKNAGVTTVVFTGDPIMPAYFTAEATAQDYFPEWVIAGTVLADTNVFARRFDPKQWSHAFGESLIGAGTPKEESSAYRLHEWWFGTAPPAENSFAIVLANVQFLFNGVHLAGPKLTPESFRDGIYRLPVPGQGPKGLVPSVTYGEKGIWPGVDVSGLDNVTLIWWDPDAEGEDETGAVAKGMYRYVDGGRRYLPGEWPTEPIPLFDPEGTVTQYPTTPDELKAPDYPPPDRG